MVVVGPRITSRVLEVVTSDGTVTESLCFGLVPRVPGVTLVLFAVIKARMHCHGRFVVVAVRQRVIVVAHVLQSLGSAIFHGVRVMGRMSAVQEVRDVGVLHIGLGNSKSIVSTEGR